MSKDEAPPAQIVSCISALLHYGGLQEKVDVANTKQDIKELLKRLEGLTAEDGAARLVFQTALPQDDRATLKAYVKRKFERLECHEEGPKKAMKLVFKLNRRFAHESRSPPQSNLASRRSSMDISELVVASTASPKEQQPRQVAQEVKSEAMAHEDDDVLSSKEVEGSLCVCEVHLGHPPLVASKMCPMAGPPPQPEPPLHEASLLGSSLSPHVDNIRPVEDSLEEQLVGEVQPPQHQGLLPMWEASLVERAHPATLEEEEEEAEGLLLETSASVPLLVGTDPPLPLPIAEEGLTLVETEELGTPDHAHQGVSVARGSRWMGHMWLN